MIDIAIDFDGTIVEHRFPKIGDPVPGAFAWMRQFQEAGARLVLWTMRSDCEQIGGDLLKEAVDFCREQGVEFYGINTQPEQLEWTTSPKAHCQIFIDDHALFCPLVYPEEKTIFYFGGRIRNRPYVDWSKVGPEVMRIINERT
jgi:hypothetical protein